MVQEQAADPAVVKADESKQQQEEAPKPFSVKEGMQNVVSLLEKSVKTKETRILMGRLMRQTAMVRKHMTSADLAGFIRTYLPEESSSITYLSGYVKQVHGRTGNAQPFPATENSCAVDQCSQTCNSDVVSTAPQQVMPFVLCRTQKPLPWRMTQQQQTA